ncbi:hypothetical protein HOY80DRAFT_1091620 [Tuber brumale]|nr:hypothetical protein HOY80DRAFT_1091620 [Tuber brumale]
MASLFEDGKPKSFGLPESGINILSNHPVRHWETFLLKPKGRMKSTSVFKLDHEKVPDIPPQYFDTPPHLESFCGHWWGFNAGSPSFIFFGAILRLSSRTLCHCLGSVAKAISLKFYPPSCADEAPRSTPPQEDPMSVGTHPKTKLTASLRQERRTLGKGKGSDTTAEDRGQVNDPPSPAQADVESLLLPNRFPRRRAKLLSMNDVVPDGIMADAAMGFRIIGDLHDRHWTCYVFYDFGGQ